MRFQNLPRPPMFFFLLILLLVGQLPSYSEGRRIMKRWKAEYSSPSMGYFSKISPSQEHDDNDFDPMYGASKRLVPQGPNPLHN